MDGMQTKIAGPSSLTRLWTGTGGKGPPLVGLPRGINRRWKPKEWKGGKGPAIEESGRSLRLQKPKRTISAGARSIGSPKQKTTRKPSPNEEGWKAPGCKVKWVRTPIAPKNYKK